MGLGCGSCGGDSVPLGMGYLMGLGCDCSDIDPDTGMCLDPDSCTVDQPIVTTSPITLNCPGDPGCPGNTALPSPVVTSSPSGASAAETSALANLAAAWTKIAGQTIAPQTTITTPQGLQVQTPAGQTSALASILGGTSTALNTANISALLPWLLIAGAGLLLFKAVNK